MTVMIAVIAVQCRRESVKRSQKKRYFAASSDDSKGNSQEMNILYLFI